MGMTSGRRMSMRAALPSRGGLGWWWWDLAVVCDGQEPDSPLCVLKDACDDHCEAFGGTHRAPNATEVLAAKYGKETAPAIYALCRKEAYSRDTGQIDLDELDEYVSVA